MIVDCYRPRSEGYVFTGVCHSFCSTGGGGVGRSQHLPPGQHSPLGPGHNTSLPPGTRSQYLPPPGTWSQHLPSPGTQSQHLLPPGPGHNTSLPPGTRSQHLPPLPPGPGHNTSLPPPRDYAQAGGTHYTGMHSCSFYQA